VPGLGDLPVAGRLFSHTLDNKTRTEIVLLITPRLVRQLARPEAGAVEFAAGTEAATGAPRLGGEIAPLPLQPQAPQPPIPTPPGAPDASGLPSIPLPQPSSPPLVPFGGVKPSAQ
jgi:general secretion pathway protein D